MIVSLASCGGDTKADGGGAVSENGAVNLKLNLQPGEEFKQVANMEYNVSIKSQENVLNQKLNLGLTMDQKVLSAAEQTVIDMRLSRVKLTMEALGNTIEYDSDMPVDSTNPVNKNMDLVFGNMLGLPLNLTFADNAALQSVSGTEAMLDSLVVITGLKREQLEKFSKNTSQNMGNFAVILPGKPVKVGDTWSGQSSFTSQGYPMISDNTYTLTDLKDGVATITMEGKIDLDSLGMKDLGFEPGDMTMTGTQTGTLEVNQATGWTTGGTIDQDLNLSMSMMGVEMSMNLKGNINITTPKGEM